MRNFRTFIRRPAGRIVTMALLVAIAHAFIDPQNYLYALEYDRQREAEIRTIAKNLNVDPEFLLHPEGQKSSFNLASLFAWAESKLSTAPNAKAPEAASDPRESMARVKQRYALVAADTTFSKIATLLKLAASSPKQRGKHKGQIKGEIESVLRLIDRNALPPLREGLPPAAQSRDRAMRNALGDVQRQIRQVISSPQALDEKNIDATLTRLRDALNGTMSARQLAPRWTKDPFPLKDTYRAAPKKEGKPGYGGTSSSSLSSLVAAPAVAPSVKRATSSVPSEVAAFAVTLGTPAKAFTWVHDNIQWETYSGVAKGSLGTLKEGRGNDWDQALLLRDLLTAQGYSAQLEWGKVTLPIARAMNLAGTEDALQAANLFATGGLDGVVLTSGSAPNAIQMTHVWVRAYVPFLPNRGATNGTPDTWVRMDPSFKRYDYDPGIDIKSVTWNEDEYLQTSAVRAPIDFYGDKIWSYIRANNIDCKNLGQVPKTAHLHAERFPFIPSTLTTSIDQQLGLAADAPADQLQRVSLTLTDANNAPVVAYNTDMASLWGRKLTLTFAPATPSDAQIIDSYGGLFNTPAYLINLKPVISLDDATVVEGSPVAAGAALSLTVGFHQPNVGDDSVRHDVVAGETHAIVLDPGAVPDSLVTARARHYQQLVTAGISTSEPAVSEKLMLIGLRYMQHIDDGVAFASGVRWHRDVKRVFEADVRRQVDVRYSIAGTALRLVPAENNIDVARLLVGMVPIGNDASRRGEVLSLAGIESSYREASIWEEMENQQGISAAKALLLARRNGQTIYTVNVGNVDAVLAAASLPDDVENEIRGAVAQGRIAKLAPQPVSLGHWSGTGYILEDPTTGAATYPISGGLAGGADTAEAIAAVKDLLGSESWLGDSPLGELLKQFLALMGSGDGNSSNAPSTTKSDPVNLSSGNLWRTATDLSVVARGIPVAISRTYNSRSTYDGPFGYGWTWNYGEMVIPNGDGNLTYRESDGTEHLFEMNAGSYISPRGKHIALTSVGSGWMMQFKDGTQFTFNAAGYLVAQTDLNGNTVTVHRDANELPTSVVDASNRTVLTFTTANGKITKITDLSGRSVTYNYTGSDLTSVIDLAGKSWSMGYDLGHNLTSFADPLGNAQRYDYDGDDRMFHHVDATGAEELFHYDIAAREAVLTDRRGNDRLIEFDDLGRAIMEADPAGNVVRAAFDTDNNRTAVIDARGQTTNFEFDGAGNKIKQMNPDGGMVTTTYDDHARPLVSTDALGAVTTNTYDSSGNLRTSTRSVGSASETTTNAYDVHGQPLTTTDPNGGVTSMTWNANGSLATRTDAANNTTTMMTDDVGRVTTIKDPAQNETKLTYDAKDRILSMTDPYGNPMLFAYDDAGRRASVTTPRGTTAYSYDAEGRVVSVRDPLGNTTLTSYDAAGETIARTDARGNITRYEYDSIGRVTRLTDAAGSVWTYGYCSSLGIGGGTSGTFCDLVDPKGNRTHQDFDAMGRVVSLTDSLGHTMFTQYDNAGRKTVETDSNGNGTRYQYDYAGRLTSVAEASGAITSYTYDKNGNKLTQKDANGHVWSFKYDALNRLIQESDPLSRKTTYTYDVLGNLKTKTDAKQQTLTYAYQIRRLMSVTYPNGTRDDFGYDALGRRISQSNANVTLTYTYDSLNRIKTVVNGAAGLATAYDYDANGNRAKLTTTWGGSSVGVAVYSYDGKNRLSSISDSALGVFRFSYDSMDRRTSLQYPNGMIASYAYDNAYRLTAMVTKNSAAQVIDAWSYQYDAVGDRTSKTDMDGKAEQYRYDNTYRLTDVAYSDGSRETFTYDAVGNRVSRSTGSGAPTLYAYDAANQLLSAGSDNFTYDANGNEVTKTRQNGTTTFTYDFQNRITRIAGPEGVETSTYATDGTRVTYQTPQTAGGWVITDTTGNPVFDLANPTVYRVFGPGVDEPLGESYNGATKRYLHHDALGSVTAASDASGALTYRRAYEAFGTMHTKSSVGDGLESRLSYTSREMSAGSLLNYRSRYYDTSYGRFAQQDRKRGQALMPPSLHRYTYVLNDPVDLMDPTGNTPISSFQVLLIAVDIIITMMLVFALMTLMTATGNAYANALVGSLILGALEAANILFKIVRAAKTDVQTNGGKPGGPSKATFAFIDATIMGMEFVGFVVAIAGAAVFGHIFLEAMLGAQPGCAQGCAAIILMALYSALIAVIITFAEEWMLLDEAPEVADHVGTEIEQVVGWA